MYPHTFPVVHTQGAVLDGKTGDLSYDSPPTISGNVIEYMYMYVDMAPRYTLQAQLVLRLVFHSYYMYALLQG